MALRVRYEGSCLTSHRTRSATLPLSEPLPATTTGHYTICCKKISVLRSWRWAKVCPKHVELILEINKLLLLHLIGFLYYFTYYVEIKCQLDATDDFYWRSYCLLDIFRAPLCPSSGAREYYKSGCYLSYLVLWFSSSPQTGHTTLSSTPYRQLENQAPNTTASNHFYNTLELLMMGIMVPETCWASNKICSKNHLLYLVGFLFPHTY